MLSILHLQSHEISSINLFALVIPAITLNTLTFTYFVLIGAHVFVDKSSTALQILLHLSRLIING